MKKNEEVKVKVSDISTIIFCQRAYYFKKHYLADTLKSVSQIQAAREIYFSKRLNFKNWQEWAKNRFMMLYNNSNNEQEYKKLEEIFNKTLKNFKFSDDLHDLKSIDTEIILRSEKFKLSGKLDELVISNSKDEINKILPLIISLKAPEKEVWFNDKIKLAAFCILLENDEKYKNANNNLNYKNFNSGFVYYCYSGKLVNIDISRRDKHDVIKAIERAIKIQNGFIPDKLKSKKCDKCKYKDVCSETKETFASKFL